MQNLQPASLKGSARFPAPLLDCYAFHRALFPRLAARLALKCARTDVALGVTRYPAYTLPHGRPWGGVSWQPDSRGLAHVENPERHGFRLVGRVESEPGYRNGYFQTRGFGGWFTRPDGDYSNRDGDGLAWGVVYMLPGRKGATRFVAGYQFGGTDGGPTLDLSRVYSEAMGGDWGYCAPTDLDASRDAARAANAMAESAAEDERAYQTAWAAGSQWADLGEQIRDAGKALNAMAKECKAARALADKFPAMRAAIAGSYADLLADIRRMRAERAKLKAGDAEGLYFYPDAKLTAAFNEAAGL